MAAPTVVQVKQTAKANIAGGSNTTITVTLDSVPTAGNLLVLGLFVLAGFGLAQAGWTQVSEVFGNTSTGSSGTPTNGNYTTLHIAKRTVVAGDGASWTFTVPGVATSYSIHAVIYEISGADSTVPILATSSNAQAGVLGVIPARSGIVGAGASNLLAIGMCVAFTNTNTAFGGISGASTPSTGWTTDGNTSVSTAFGSLCSAHQALSGTGGAEIQMTFSSVNVNNQGSAGTVLLLQSAPSAGVQYRQMAQVLSSANIGFSAMLPQVPLASTTTVVGFAANISDTSYPVPAGFSSVATADGANGTGSLQLTAFYGDGTGVQTASVAGLATSHTSQTTGACMGVITLYEVSGVFIAGDSATGANNQGTDTPVTTGSMSAVIDGVALAACGTFANGSRNTINAGSTTPGGKWQVGSDTVDGAPDMFGAWMTSTAAINKNDSLQSSFTYTKVNSGNTVAAAALVFIRANPTNLSRYMYAPAVRRASVI